MSSSEAVGSLEVGQLYSQPALSFLTRSSPIHCTLDAGRLGWAGPDLSLSVKTRSDISNIETISSQPAAQHSLLSLRLTRDWPQVELSETSHLIFTATSTQTGGGGSELNKRNL